MTIRWFIPTMAFATVFLALSILAFAQEVPESPATARDVAATEDVQLPPELVFPRDLAIRGGTVTVYQPQIEDYDIDSGITGWSATVVKLDASDEPIYGAIRFHADVTANMAERTVTFYDRILIDYQFPDLTDQQSAELMVRFKAALIQRPTALPLDAVLPMLQNADAPPEVAVSYEPPDIIYSDRDAVLVLFDGEPEFSPISDPEAGWQLEFAVNTGWNVLKEKDDDRMWLKIAGGWVWADKPDGAWTPARTMPAAFDDVPGDENWAEVKAAIPGENLFEIDLPVIHVRKAPAELIETRGMPALDQVTTDGLLYVTNTESDLFYESNTRLWYYLVAGRWFSATDLNGPWTHVPDLPETFSRIPENHPLAHARASVKGTQEATYAVLQTQIPEKAEVQRSEAQAQVHYAGEPKFEPIESIGVYRAVNTSAHVLRVGDKYYLCQDGIWFFSYKPDGPWIVADTVPQEIYDIPITSPAHSVTYVHVYSSTPTTVYVGYTPGYTCSYVSNGVVVWCSGYYTPAYYGYYSWRYYPYYRYPYYYRPAYRSYGLRAYYNPRTGGYIRGGYAHGYYGGVARGSSYNPRTGAYSHSRAFWTSDAAGFQRVSQNPLTGDGSATRQYANKYGSWGESVVSRGDDWVHTKRFTDDDGTRIGIENSEGGRGAIGIGDDNRGFIGQSGDGDLYVGGNGNVFRKTEDGWERRQDGDWSQIEGPGGNRPNDATPSQGAARDRTAQFDQLNQNRDARRSDRSQSPTTSRSYSSLGSQNTSVQSLDRAARARTTGTDQYRSYQRNRSSYGSSYSGRSMNRTGRFR